MERDNDRDVLSNAFAMLEATLFPLTGMMIRNGMSAGDLIQAVKVSFLQAAIAEVISPGSKVNVSRLAVVTGLTRKDVASLLRRRTEKRSNLLHGKKSLEHRALRVLHGWSADPMFQRSNRRPGELPLHGERQRSFAMLVRRYGGDVTPLSVLRELERTGAAKVTRAGRVKLIKTRIQHAKQSDQRMVEFNRLIRDFSTTIRQILEPKDPAIFFAFKDSTVSSPQHAALFHRTFSRRAAALVEGIDQWATHQGRTKGKNHLASKSRARVGLGVYLIQDDE